MSERKVLNKYYPPDYDPSKIPKLKRAKDRQYVIRVMAPFHMRCKTCGNYIYKGTKFNARMETVQDEDYLGLRIYRFYIKCTKCVAEITFKTDPVNMDYSIEHGATRNFEAEKLLEKEEKRLQVQKEEDESNPMKMLEIRTRDSKREMEMMENLEELRELNERHIAINYDDMLKRRQETDEERKARERAEEDEEIEKIFTNDMVRRLQDNDSGDEIIEAPPTKKRLLPPTEILTKETEESSSNIPPKKYLKIENQNTKKRTAKMLGIVKKAKQGTSSSTSPTTQNNQTQGLSLLNCYGTSSEEENE